jgi:REP element-mobilizing transposase RayT
MAIHKFTNKAGIYFITFTCHNWIPLIEKTNSYDVLYNFFEVLQQKGNSICGYVIMPNHVHFLMHYKVQQSLNTIIGNGKRFAAYELVNRLKSNSENELLSLLSASVASKDKNKGQKHMVWKESFDVKDCRTEAFIEQKLHYMHNNPLNGKWKLCRQSIDYPHSSARFYFTGTEGNCPITDYRVILATELKKQHT